MTQPYEYAVTGEILYTTEDCDNPAPLGVEFPARLVWTDFEFMFFVDDGFSFTVPANSKVIWVRFSLNGAMIFFAPFQTATFRTRGRIAPGDIVHVGKR